MVAFQQQGDEPGAPGTGGSVAQRLERGEVIFYPSCPFRLPEGDDLRFLLAQRLGHRAHKNISYDPLSGKVNGYHKQAPDQVERLQNLLAAFSGIATAWVANTLPRYTEGWRLDRVSFRPEEEATRRLRLTARNDLLHVDAFPSRPTNGWRILRVFVNINPSEPRVWVTSLPFAQLLQRYGEKAGLPGSLPRDLWRTVCDRILKLVHPVRARRSAYDEFMLRFHDFLKMSEGFQEKAPKRLWTFPPGSCWLAMTDTASHAVLRGRYALEHSYFVAPQALALPEESPAALLERACGTPVLHRARNASRPGRAA
jgi:hypothetical protein